VMVLAGVAALLIVAFGGKTTALIPLYAVGVFISFTLSQAGMVRHHQRLREPHWKRGVVINVSSVHELIPRPNYLSYSISKGGMGNLTRTLALEYARRGIRVNGVGPGATITPINRAWTDDPIKIDIVSSHIPLGRAGTADEMAGVCAFLASEDAAYITGQTVFVDGGLTLYADFREPWSAE